LPSHSSRKSLRKRDANPSQNEIRPSRSDQRHPVDGRQFVSLTSLETDREPEFVGQSAPSNLSAATENAGLHPDDQIFRPLPANHSVDDVAPKSARLPVNAVNFDGRFEIREGDAVGWVTGHRLEIRPIDLVIMDQFDRNIGQGLLDAASGQSESLFNPIHFRIPLNDACFSGQELRLTARANGVSFATSTCKLGLTGTLEFLSESRCSGWLFSPDAPSRSFDIEILRNGNRVAVARADMDRADVTAVFPNAIAPGFDTELPSDVFLSSELAAISLRLVGSDSELLDGPYIIGTRTAVVNVARSVVRHSLIAAPGATDIEIAILRAAIADFLKIHRKDQTFLLRTAALRAHHVPNSTRINIVIPIYRDVKVTRACIESVLACRNAITDRVLLINDCSPDAEMPSLLELFAHKPNVFVINNEINRGFVGSVNRAISFRTDGDVLVLNSDTEVYPGGLDEICRIAKSGADIGTVTAISNNATIFSYPHMKLRVPALEDMTWPQIAAIALERNSGLAIDVPTGHGFCLLLKRELLSTIGQFDAAFGRGYGEENDFCARGADLGYRNVAAGGAFVLHRESISFGEDDKSRQLAANLPILQARYPEYTPLIMDYERTDDLRRMRWAIDIQRLVAARSAGQRLTLVVTNQLGGGTARAIRDLGKLLDTGGRDTITLECRTDGFMEVHGNRPLLRAQFAPGEDDFLFSLLSAAGFDLILVHQVLGFPSATIRRLGLWARDYKSVFYAHDYYSLCPRVTMVDAVGHFCDVAPVEVCDRCVVHGGAHKSAHASMLTALNHRELFKEFLGAFRHIVSPSQSAANYLRRGFPDLQITVVPHPEPPVAFPAAARTGTCDEVLLLGAINADKGSGTLLELARRAQLLQPNLRFRVIGHTDIDRQLAAVGNVIITGPYKPNDLDARIHVARGRLALFLQGWPETYSYTLSEVVRYGFIPLVPDIGAPAERVRATGFGVVFSFPIDVDEVLNTIDGIARGSMQPWREGSSPRDYATPQTLVNDTLQLLTIRSSLPA
jgi:GT2 family glycosyltransferase